MFAAAQSTSGATAVLGIIVVILIWIGFVAVGRWLARRVGMNPPQAGELVSRWRRRYRPPRHHAPRRERWIVPADAAPPSPAAVHPQPPPTQPAATPQRPAAHQQSGSAAGEAGAAEPQPAVQEAVGPPGVPGAGREPAAAPAASAGTTEPAPPAHPGERCQPSTLEVIGKALAISRSVMYAEERVAESLAELPTDRWHVEPGVFIAASYRIPFLILGETGVFTVWAAVAPPHWEHLLLATQAAVEVKKLLPGYEGEVRSGYCRALAREEVRPRLWVRPETAGDDQHRAYRAGPGAWVLDRHWLVRWLESFGSEQGVGVKDLERLRVLARQRPTRSAVPPPGATPFIDLVPNL